MSDQVRISSIEALEAFRTDLLRYLRQAGAALDDMVGEVRRTRAWLENDQVPHWTHQYRQRKKLLEQAEQELYSANLHSPDATHAQQKMAVARAERAVSEAEDHLRVLKKWRQQFDPRTDPLVRQLDRMFHQVGNQLPKGVHSLGESIVALQAYTEVPPAEPDSPPPPPP